MFNPQTIKSDFPIFKHDPSLVYLDSAATSLKPTYVINALNDYYSKYSANVFRGIYKISEKATLEYENARKKVARFINAKSEEIIFTRSTTESINLISYSWGQENIKKGDEVISTLMEHHSNFVPWQQIAQKNRAKFTVWDVSKDGYLNHDFDKISKKTKLIALVHVSNVLGTINPVKKIVESIKRKNPKTLVLIDAAQSVPHMKIDVKRLGCDFLAFSSHKMLGPTGVGVLWARRELLEEMKPFNYGGDMIKEVRVGKTLFNNIPHKFEAGTPNIAGVIGLGAAVSYLQKLGMGNIRRHEQEIITYALKQLGQLHFIKILGPKDPSKKGGVVAFCIDGIHAHDVSQVLDFENIATRSGHHCAMPLHEKYDLAATTRTSFYVYTTKEDINKLMEGLKKVYRYFK